MRTMVVIACQDSQLLKVAISDLPAASFEEKGNYEDVNYYSNL